MTDRHGRRHTRQTPDPDSTDKSGSGEHTGRISVSRSPLAPPETKLLYWDPLTPYAMFQELGVQLLSNFHHGDVVANRLDLRCTGRNDREEAHEDLGGVIGVDHHKEVVTWRVDPSSDHLVHVLRKRVENRSEGVSNRRLVVCRTRGLVMMMGDVKEHPVASPVVVGSR